jgi:hypothetical protein
MRRKDAVARTESELEARERALATLASMRRENLSLTAAADSVGIDPRTVLRYVGSALRQGPDGEYRATPQDSIPRTLHFITPAGTVPITVADSRTASRIAEHMNAVRSFTHRGDSSVLEAFRGESFQAEGTIHEFVTDLPTLSRLADAGELAIERLYRAVQR